MQIRIQDYDGIISIVNSDRYLSFVDKNWELEQIKSHFVEQMNSQNIIVWQTNNFGGGNWNIEILNSPSNKLSHSEFIKTIEVTDNKLFVSNYTDLTMVAQFDDEKIPSKHNSDKFIALENGLYQLTIRRMFNPNEEFDETNVAFEVVIKKTSEENKNDTEKIYWWTF